MILGLTPQITLAKYEAAVPKASIKIINHPTLVKAGGTVDIELAWDEIPLDKGYKLRVQLENWDVSPGICVVKDITQFTAKGTMVVSLKVPNDTRASKGLRFLAAFMSTTEEWKNVLVMASTRKDVTVKGLLDVSEYPKSIKMGEVAQVKIEWEGLPKDLAKDYKIIVQLENCDVEPGIVVVEEVDTFDATGSSTVSLDVPADLTTDPVKGCRFVAAFVSRAKGWDDVFYMTTTSKDVEIK
jgi:hypothetical protein